MLSNKQMAWALVFLLDARWRISKFVTPGTRARKQIDYDYSYVHLNQFFRNEKTKALNLNVGYSDIRFAI